MSSLKLLLIACLLLTAVPCLYAAESTSTTEKFTHKKRTVVAHGRPKAKVRRKRRLSDRAPKTAPRSKNSSRYESPMFPPEKD